MKVSIYWQEKHIKVLKKFCTENFFVTPAIIEIILDIKYILVCTEFQQMVSYKVEIK
jgi:hypothetical protein